MYPPSDWSMCSEAAWISARMRSRYRTGLDRAIWVTSVRTRSEDRTSISSHPLADLGWKLLIGLRHRLLLILAPHVAQFLCSSQGLFLRPGPQSVDRVSPTGAQSRPSPLPFPWLPRCPAPP